MKVYNKLVRDRISEIIEKDGKKYEVSIADKEKHFQLLQDKLNEEVGEFLQDKNLEELADIMEVLFGLANNLGYSEEALVKMREDKKDKRGGFDKGIVLHKTWE